MTAITSRFIPSLTVVSALALGVATVGTTFSSAQAVTFTTPTPISNLLVGTGNDFLIGDKLFSNFTYILSGDAQPPATAVTVSGNNSNPNVPALNFNGSFSGTTGGLADIALSFEVDVLDTTQSITGFDVGISGATGASNFNVVSEVFTAPLGSLLAKIDTIVTNGIALDNPVGVVSFAPQSSIFVQQDISRSLTPGDSFLFSIDTKTFTQVGGPPPEAPVGVPESSTNLGILVLAGLGLSTVLKKKQN